MSNKKSSEGSRQPRRKYSTEVMERNETCYSLGSGASQQKKQQRKPVKDHANPKRERATVLIDASTHLESNRVLLVLAFLQPIHGSMHPSQHRIYSLAPVYKEWFVVVHHYDCALARAYVLLLRWGPSWACRLGIATAACSSAVQGRGGGSSVGLATQWSMSG